MKFEIFLPIGFVEFGAVRVSHTTKLLDIISTDRSWVSDSTLFLRSNGLV